MHIILLILKIIGIALLVILSLVLLCVILVLFVPVRYRADLERRGKIKGRAIAKWLFPVFYAKAAYEEEKITYCVRVLGFRIYPKKVKKKKDKKKKEDRKELVIAEVKPSKPGQEKKEIFLKSSGAEGTQDTRDKNTFDDKEILSREESTCRDNEDKDSLPEKLWRLIGRMKAFFSRFFAGIRQLKSKAGALLLNLKQLKGKGGLVAAFFLSEDNLPGFLCIWESVKGLLKHIAPGKIKGEIYFGTNDPCITGQILGVIGILYGFYGENLTVIPDFEKPVLEGELFIKGRIRVFTLLRICITLLKDNHFKQVKDNFNKMKEEL